MFEGQMLIKGSGSGTIVFSPWFPRHGDSVRCALDLEAATTNGTLTVDLFTKNTEDTGDGSNSDSSGSAKITSTAGTPGRYAAEWVSKGTIGLKELVRYRFTAGGSAATDWVLFRMLPPVWFDSVAPA